MEILSGNSSAGSVSFDAQDAENKFSRLSELPSLPTILMDALQQLEGQQDMVSLIDKIGRDPVLVARLLRIANSSFYGMSREIGSLREAIVVLGFNRVRDLLISICFSQMLVSQQHHFDYTDFWHHSMAVADCSRQLARSTGFNPDVAFTAGLLHDIGQLVIVFLYPEEIVRQIFNTQTEGSFAKSHHEITENERKILTFDHTEIGSKSALYWNFPEVIQQAIEQHETAPLADSTPSVGLLIYSANLLVIMASSCADDSAVDINLRVALEILAVPIGSALSLAEHARAFADQVISAN